MDKICPTGLTGLTSLTGPTCQKILLSLSIVIIWSLLLISSVGFAQEDLIGDIIQEQIKQEQKTSPKRTHEKERSFPKDTSQTTAEKKWVIVIDPGHGGKDTGAIGHRKIREKDIVLALSRRIAKVLKKRFKAEIILTRSKDRFISLEKRDRIAVSKKADIFLSIHANAASRKKANGIEIYYLDNATDEAAERLAVRENRGSQKSLSDLKKILSTLIQTESTELSRILAKEIYASLKKRVASRYKVERLYIRTALFYVLVGAQAPSVLLEVGFVTNPKEARRLTQKEYQEHYAEAISEGIERYFKTLQSQKVNI